MVKVPVLSKMTVSTCAAVSMCVPPLIRIPLRAACPMLAETAVGVARPAAQGQAITSMVMARLRSPVTRSVTAAMPSEIGTNWPAKRVPIFSIGAFLIADVFDGVDHSGHDGIVHEIGDLDVDVPGLDQGPRIDGVAHGLFARESTRP